MDESLLPSPLVPAGAHENHVRPFGGADVHRTSAITPPRLPQAGEGGLDERHFDRMRWRCRRGLLELDVVLKNFLEQGYRALAPAERDAFDKLLTVPDNILWAYVQGSEIPSEIELRQIVSKIGK